MKKQNFNIKIIIKITLAIFGLAVIITPIAYFATARINLSSLTASGSSAVFPLVKAFAEEYVPADVTVQAGGSGVGIQAILNGTRDIGMVSKNPIDDFIDHGGEKPIGEWAQREIKTVTIAWDGMALVYRDASNANSINLNKTVMQEVYRAFAGNEIVTYDDLGITGNMTSITPFARTGGADASGTADSFLKSTGLLNDIEQEKVESNFPQLQNGTYGSLTRQTPESNSQSLQQVLASNNPGSMVYLSAGFTINNLVDINAAGFKIATYQGVPLETSNITKGYNWFRPLNVLFSLVDSTPGLRDFILYMVSLDNPDSESQKIILEEGFINLSQEQKSTMKDRAESFFVSDSILGYTGALATPVLPSSPKIIDLSLENNNEKNILKKVYQTIINDFHPTKLDKNHNSWEIND